MNTKNEQDLNNYDFLTLLGFKNVKEEDRSRIDSQLGALVWEEFLTKKLETELGEEGVKKVNDMVGGGHKSEEIINFIVGKIPTIKDILESILIQAKKELLKEYYQKMLENTDRTLFSTSIPEKGRESIRKRKNKYLTAKELFDKEDWQGLYKLMGE